VTTGDQSSGLAAQSIGGGGGNGGWSITGAISNNTNLTLALGGNGGTAGNAGSVLLTSRKSIETTGNDADAILAQSIGGGGGNGGFSIGAGFANNGFQLADSFGGNGGTAGSGGDIRLTSGQAGQPVVIITKGAASDGILAQSIGGGGGNGGFTVNASATGDGDGQPDAAKFGMAAFNIGYGTCTVCPGSGGGDANSAGTVGVFSNSRITTNGDNANAIAAQSIGGGGGKGAITIGATVDNTGPSAQIQFGSGGSGGNGGDVDVTSEQLLLTNGANSDGILAQSVGGGGGYGGLRATNGFITDIPGVSGLNLGQHGDVGGNAGDVTVENTSSILTKGGNAIGVAAQSIGGGGGQGGWSISGGFSLQQGVASSVLNYAFGSNGGAGGNAGDVTQKNTAAEIETKGTQADGILAQSVGGGGGDGGFAINGAITPGWAVGFSMGGQGGSAGAAGTVSVTSSAVILTSGDLSSGIVAQSIGGGGGSGGFAIEGLGTTGITVDSAVGGFGQAGSDGNTAFAHNSGEIETTGEGANGILVQSIGGGGGNGGWAIAGAATTNRSASISFGGFGKAGGNGGGAGVINTANIVTKGANSTAVEAESLGGGGGNGGFDVAGGITGKGNIAFSLGGFAGTGGNGGTVALGNSAGIRTYGNSAEGLLAASLGGGGGSGGFSVAGGIGGGPAVDLAIGGHGSTGGSGGGVTLVNTGIVETTGELADAVAAQSVGGGGGDGGWTIAGTATGNDSAFSATLGLGGSAGTGGDGGTVTETNRASLETTGDDSAALVAQSIGGGGGQGGFSIAGTGSLGKRNLTLAIGGSGGDAGNGGS